MSVDTSQRWLRRLFTETDLALRMMMSDRRQTLQQNPSAGGLR